MFIDQTKDVNLYQFVVSKGRECGFDHMLANLKITDAVTERVDKGGAYIYFLDIYSLQNKNELRQALNKAQRDFV